MHVYLWGLGSFCSSLSCRIMRHFPVSPLGLEMDIPLDASLKHIVISDVIAEGLVWAADCSWQQCRRCVCGGVSTCCRCHHLLLPSPSSCWGSRWSSDNVLYSWRKLLQSTVYKVTCGTQKTGGHIITLLLQSKLRQICMKPKSLWNMLLHKHYWTDLQPWVSTWPWQNISHQSTFKLGGFGFVSSTEVWYFVAESLLTV